MTSHDVCRQHRPLFRPEQWPAAFPVACQAGGSEGASSTAGGGEMAFGRIRIMRSPRPSSRRAGTPGSAGHGLHDPRGKGEGLVRGGEGLPGTGIPGQASGGPPTRSPVTPWMSVSQAARPQAGLGPCDHLLGGWCDRRKSRRRASPGLLPRWGRAPCT